MSQQMLERIVEDVKTLTPPEQQQLRNMLDQGFSHSGEQVLLQRQLLERLVDKGIIEKIPSGLYAKESQDLHPPIKVKGKPVSETLLEDRE